ncbi:MAG: ABC transporter ATP-binding protein, partial [Clostridia bacterium]
MIAVETDHLSKIYIGGNKAVDDVSFRLEQGAVFGFLGPNGAGKTTTIKLLCGMLAPTSGSCRVFDLDPAQNPEKLHQLCGVITEHAQMYDHLSGLQNLIFYGTLFGMGASDCEKRANSLLERLDLMEARERKLSAYSTGMRQRLSLARAMIHSPKILFLDEPTSGLDPESAQNVNTLIGELAASGTTIFLCTHQLRYAQEICTTYGLMNEGSLLAAGTLEALRAMISTKTEVRVNASRMPAGIEYLKTDENTYRITVNSQEEIPSIVNKIVAAGGDIYHVS